MLCLFFAQGFEICRPYLGSGCVVWLAPCRPSITGCTRPHSGHSLQSTHSSPLTHVLPHLLPVPAASAALPWCLAATQVVGPRNKAATARGSKEVAERTPVSQLFGGAMQSTVRTRPVGPSAPSKPSVTQQPMFAVHLEAHHNSLEEAFVALTRPEQISGGSVLGVGRKEGGCVLHCVLRCAVLAWSEGG